MRSVVTLSFVLCMALVLTSGSVLADAPIGSTISLYAIENSRYLAISPCDNVLYADQTAVNACGKFLIEDAGGGNIKLKAYNNNYVRAIDGDADAPCDATIATGDEILWQWDEVDATTTRLISNVSTKRMRVDMNSAEKHVDSTGGTGSWAQFTWAVVSPGGGDTTPPAAPTGLSAISNGNNITLDWNDNGESDLACYSVHRSTTSGSGYTQIAYGLGTSSYLYVDTDAYCGATYYYVVTATDTAGNISSHSNEVTVTIPPSLTGDITHDCRVNMLDLWQLSLHWLTDDAECDIAPSPDGDGTVNLLDVAALAENWMEVTAPFPVEGDVTFFVISDTHLESSSLSTNQAMIDEMNALVGVSYPVAVGGVVDTPRGVCLTGDITEGGGRDPEWTMWVGEYGLTGENRCDFPLYEGWGNHDDAIDGTCKAKPGIQTRNLTRPDVVNISSNGYHYSWDWDHIHCIQLNIYAGNSGRNHDNPEASLPFLIDDLALHIGDTGRPVIIFQHFDMYADTVWWTADEKTAMYNAIQNYNIIGIFVGHSHWAQHVTWNGIDTYNPGAVISGSKQMLVVQIVDDQMDVVYRSNGNWNSVWQQKTISLPVFP